MAKFLCGTPNDICIGNQLAVSSGIGKSRKIHVSPVDAFKCHTRYLLKLNYKQIGTREFVDPITNSIRILTRPGKFGGRLRTGKEGTRHMPGEHRDQYGGLVISK
jgi:hypothetical protein